MKLWVLALVAVVGGNAFAGAPDGGTLNVTVRGESSGNSVPVRGVYLALFPMDESAARPAVEAVGDGGIQWRDIASGQYALIAEAGSFDPVFLKVDIAGGKNQEVGIVLQPQAELTGNIVDVQDRPISGARVCHPRVATAALMNSMSRLAHRNATEHQCARTDENGWWKLHAPPSHASELLVEASGYEPVWVKRESADGRMPTITLNKGSSLRIVTDRAVPGLILALIPAERIASSIPLWAQKSIWGREVATTVVEWTSLPAGDYDVVAAFPDPRRFSAPVTLRRVTVGGTGPGEIQLSLPEEPPVRERTTRIYFSPKTEIGGLRAFVRTPSGVRQVPTASELTPRGRVLYADADIDPQDVFFTTAGEVILAARRGQREESSVQRAAVEGIKFPKADGKLRVALPEGGALPSRGNATFSRCPNEARFVLPVEVTRNGDVSLPLLVGCSALTLRFDNFSPLALASRARPREEVWLGAHTLKAPATAEVHVVQEPNGTNVAEAIVTASVERAPGEFLEIVKRVAAADGRLVMDGLPAGEEITFRAEEPSTRLTGTARQAIEPGARVSIDLPLPQAAQLTVIPRFEDRFKSENPNVEITGVAAAGEPTDRHSVELNAGQQEAVFRGLKPGTWLIRVMVRMGGLTQPVNLDPITLESGDVEKIEPVIRPLVVSGRVTARGRPTKTSLAFTDPPGPGATTRRVFSKDDGSFHTLLGRPGDYVVTARRSLNDPDIELGPIRFDESSRDVEIALPEGALSVRVVSGASGGDPVADAQITASMLGDVPQRGLYRLERKDRTGSTGEVLLDELQEGTWLLTARTKDGNVAEKTAAVTRDRATSVVLTLDSASVEGAVFDAAGAPAGMAAVDCIYSGSGNIPRMVGAQTDSQGRFTIGVARPAPQRLLCGVTTADGAIGTFITPVMSDVRFSLSPAASHLTVTNWSDRGNRDRFWLVAADGSLFDLSWAARKLGRMDAPFTIPRIPAGAWSVVRVDSPAAFDALARGGAEALPRVARIRVSPGQSQEINMQNGDDSAP